MNGIVANPTPTPSPRPTAGIVRGVLLVCCCVLSVGLIGAVHTRPFEPARPARPVLASAATDPAASSSAYEALPASFRLASPPATPAKPSPAAANKLLDNVAAVAASIRSPVEKMLISPALPPTPPPSPRSKPAPAFEVRLMEVTAYCACKKCCGPRAQGITASGKHVTHNGGKFVAADKFLPFNTRLAIPGYNNGQAVPVLDRGGAIKGNKLDVYFPSHHEARQWGRRFIPVTVLN